MIAAARVKQWFQQNAWSPLPFQREAWKAYERGKSGLIHSPTGSGKSLAVWLGPVSRAIDAHDTSRGLKVLWITPLRALAHDTAKNLQCAVDALELAWRVDVRTGDTGASTRVRQRRAPPHALITTPESLSLLLIYAETNQLFADLQSIVVDEWHELIGSKRGVQLELCLARLRALRPAVQTWGLSATLGNTKQAMETLIGPNRQGILISGVTPKVTEIRALLPRSVGRFPWGGHLGLVLLPQVLSLLERGGTSLVFTNTRSQAEQWFEALLKARPDWLDEVELHHGSIDHTLRHHIETHLRTGALRCVVCTSSLDLGVDFSPVDQVIQVGSPKGVARLIQRAGRSGHAPNAISRIECVPTHAFELVEIAAARLAAEKGQIESKKPLRMCLDVLVQHLVTMALGSGFTVSTMREEIESTSAFSGMRDEQWQWALDFITRGGQALQGYPQYQKVTVEQGLYRVTDRRIASHHRMSIGTISSQSSMNVRWLRGGMLGHIEESFIAKLNKGDNFLFAGRLVRLVQVRDMTAYVQQAMRGQRTVPRWQGGRMPLTTELADSVVSLFGKTQTTNVSEPEIRAIDDLLTLQSRWSKVPAPSILLVEYIKSREGHSVFCYPFGGRLTHEGLATLLAYRLSRLCPITFKISVNDYGFELLSQEKPPITEPILHAAFSDKHLEEDLKACMNTTELARRQFRDIARIAGLVFQGYPGKNKSTKQLQASSSLMYDVLKKYDGTNLLLEQAWQEVVDNQLQAERLRRILERITVQNISIQEPTRLTPLAFPLWAERVQSQTVSSESWRRRVLKMVQSLEKRAARRERIHVKAKSKTR
ncbi:ligase-associated DNA damage response DEXH box helicase [Candidatus Nitrospira salsa]